MKVELKEINVRELAEGYHDKGVDGVVGYGGKLDIRPPYQREFVYNDKQRAAVIDTASKGFPLNLMYWAVRDDGDFEIIDGQQRTVALCQYVTGEFSFEGRYFHNLQDDEQERILDYQLTIYQCTGADSEKLEWFKTVNIAGEELTDQELRNAVYHGSFVSDAKRYFSKPGCPAYGLASDYMKGSPIRQDYLEAVIDWTSGGNVEDYMGQHQHDPNAKGLWEYFAGVIAWVQQTFPNKRSKIMKQVHWGPLHAQYGGATLDPDELESKIAGLVADDEVEKKRGIYTYVLSRDEKELNLRQFPDSMKLSAYERQNGICPYCEEGFEYEAMHGDHIKPWIDGGKTVPENCQMLCTADNLSKGAK